MSGLTAELKVSELGAERQTEQAVKLKADLQTGLMIKEMAEVQAVLKVEVQAVLRRASGNTGG